MHITDHEAIKFEILELQELGEDSCRAEKENAILKIKVKVFFAISLRFQDTIVSFSILLEKLLLFGIG